MLEQCAQRVAKGTDALLPTYSTLCEVIHARANLMGGGCEHIYIYISRIYYNCRL